MPNYSDECRAEIAAIIRDSISEGAQLRKYAATHSPLTFKQWLGASCEACIIGPREAARLEHVHAADCERSNG